MKTQVPTNLPKDLIDAVASGEATAVVGSGPSIEAGLPSWTGLVDLMISECQQQIVGFCDAEELRTMLKGGQLTEVAGECSKLLRGQLYRDFMQRVFRPPTLRPTATHGHLLDLPFCSILTTNYDCLLEQAYVLKHATASIPPVYTQKNVAQLARLVSDKDFFILKMHGHVDDAETIVLTQRDYQKTIHLYPAYRAALSTVFAARTAVFIGYGLRDPDLNLLLSEQAAVFKWFGRRHYAFVPDPTKVLTRSLLEQYNVVVIPYNSEGGHAELKGLLLRLNKEVAKRGARPTRRGTPLPEAPVQLKRCPYKFLDYFDSSDQDFFFGRDQDTQALLQSLLAHRLVVLFGASGRGKTSLIKAAIVPELSANGDTVVDCRFTADSTSTIVAAFNRCLGLDDPEIVRDVDMYVRHICDHLRTIQARTFLILDQVECLFSGHTADSTELLGGLLQAFVTEASCECHVLLSIREDCFVRLHDLAIAVPTIFNNRYQLGPLSRPSAEAAIRGPAEMVGFQCEDGFVNEVLDDLGGASVEPPHLQIVCTAVINAVPAGTSVVTKEIYSDLGGAKAVLSDYIPEVLRSFRQNEREIARDVLKVLVTPDHRRVLVPLRTVLSHVNHSVADVVPVIDTLIFHRLIRAAESQGVPEYEISHEYLAPQIDQWISDEEREIRRIREVMTNERHICESIGTVIEVERARFLRMYVEKANFDPDDRDLIERSIEHWESMTAERESLEEQMRQAQKMESVGQLAGGIAHDFNNLLTSILGYAGLLRESIESDNDIEGYIDAIYGAAERSASLTRQLLAFSRKQVLQPTRVDVNEIVTRVTEMLARLIGEDVELKTNLTSKLPAVEVDVGMIEQVVLNLAVNARDAMPEGGTLTLGTALLEADEDYVREHREGEVGRYVCLCLEDTGSGMDAQTMARLFEPFFTTKEIGKGTGLGLATAHGIVKQHEGWIEVESAVGEGSTFKVFLPARSKPPDAEECVAGHLGTLRGSELILVAEDEGWVRNMVGDILEKYGYSVLRASDGTEAVALWDANREQVALVFADIVMPGGVSGFDLVERIRAHEPNISVVYTSGYGPQVMRHTEKLVEGVNFLQKPYRSDVLVQIVRSVLDAQGRLSQETTT